MGAISSVLDSRREGAATKSIVYIPVNLELSFSRISMVLAAGT